MADEKNARLQQSIDRARTQSHNLLAKASKELKRLKAERLAEPQPPPQPALEAHGPRGAATTCASSSAEMEIKAAEIRARRKTEQSQSEAPAVAEPECESMPPYGHAQGFPCAAPDSVETAPSAAPGSRTSAFEKADPVDWEIEAILASMRNLHNGDLVTETGQRQTDAQGRQTQSAAVESRRPADTAPTAGKIAEQTQCFPAPARARTEKIGRNAACPCNSGKKYKRCCGFAPFQTMKTAA
jgi:hypothetical protein